MREDFSPLTLIPVHNGLHSHGTAMRIRLTVPRDRLIQNGLETIVMVAKDYFTADHSAFAIVRGDNRFLFDPDGGFTPEGRGGRGRSGAERYFFGDEARIGPWLRYAH